MKKYENQKLKFSFLVCENVVSTSAGVNPY